MSDLANEELLTLAQVADFLPRRRRGRKVAISTLYRWTGAGCRGVRLEYIQVGATRCTSREALKRFFDGLTHSPSGPAEPGSTRTPAARRKAAERADEALARLGV